MSIKFDFYKTPEPQHASQVEHDKYHARVVSEGTVGFDLLVKHIHERSTVSEGDVSAVLREISKEMVLQLCEGKRVSLPGIGYFSLTLEAPKDCTPETTHNQHIQIKQVKFRADQQFKDELKEKARFERVKVKSHSATISSSELDELLVEFFKKKLLISRRELQQVCGFTSITAYRQIQRLVKEGKLVNMGTKQSPLYAQGAGLSSQDT